MLGQITSSLNIYNLVTKKSIWSFKFFKFHLWFNYFSLFINSDLCSSIRIPNPLFDLFFLASFLINMVVDGISYSFGILLEPMKMVGIYNDQTNFLIIIELCLVKIKACFCCFEKFSFK